MGSIADKLAYTSQAREEIRNAIVAKGVACPGTAPFCQFDEYIAQISGGGSSSLNLEGINITTYGSISIKNLICSGFTYGSNYIKPACSFRPGTATWEICVKLLYTTKSSRSQVIAGSLGNYYHLPSFEIQPSGVIWAGLSTGGTTWNHGVMTTKALEVNKWYYVRYRYDGTKYYIEVSTDGTSYEVWSTINTSAVTYASGEYELGGIATSNNHYMQFGHIDLKGTYIKVNDEVIWGAKCYGA